MLGSLFPQFYFDIVVGIWKSLVFSFPDFEWNDPLFAPSNKLLLDIERSLLLTLPELFELD